MGIVHFMFSRIQFQKLGRNPNQGYKRCVHKGAITGLFDESKN